MNEITVSTIPSLSINKTADMLTDAYSSLIESSLPFKTFPSVMLWGAPGVGKSQCIRQIAKNIEDRTSKKVVVTDVRLLLFNPIDLRGIPTANAEKTLAIWLKPQIFNMDSSEDIVNILFLDEISAAPQSVQAAAYQITLDRVIGEHKLPENCIVIAAGNRVTDKSVAFKMPRALANRLCHIEISAEFDSWRSWAVKTGIHQKVIGFLAFSQKHFIDESKSESLAYATPRSWEMVSNILNNINDDVKKVYPLVAGCVGTGAAVEFKTWCEIYNQLPDIKEIFSGNYTNIPKRADVMYALVTAMISYASKHRKNIAEIENSITYALRFPPEFSTFMLKSYMDISEGFKSKLMDIPAFYRWLQTNGRFFVNDN